MNKNFQLFYLFVLIFKLRSLKIQIENYAPVSVKLFPSFFQQQISLSVEAVMDNFVFHFIIQVNTVFHFFYKYLSEEVVNY